MSLDEFIVLIGDQAGTPQFARLYSVHCNWAVHFALATGHSDIFPYFHSPAYNEPKTFHPSYLPQSSKQTFHIIAKQSNWNFLHNSNL